MNLHVLFKTLTLWHQTTSGICSLRVSKTFFLARRMGSNLTYFVQMKRMFHFFKKIIALVHSLGRRSGLTESERPSRMRFAIPRLICRWNLDMESERKNAFWRKIPCGSIKIVGDNIKYIKPSATAKVSKNYSQKLSAHQKTIIVDKLVVAAVWNRNLLTPTVIHFSYL